MTDFRGFIELFGRHGVNVILIGGVAAAAHGSPAATLDIDFVYSRAPENIRLLCLALEPFRPYLRGAPAGLPFSFDPLTVEAGLNFTLVTSMGDLDLLGEVAGGGSYEQLLPDTELLDVFGAQVMVVTLPKLIQLKRAAGRTKDLIAISLLESLLDARRQKE